LETPCDLNKVIVCKLCGEEMHWQSINEYVGFWLHKGKSIQKCGGLNPLMKGKPMIAQNMGYYYKVKKMWKELVTVRNARQNSRKSKKMH